MSPTDPTPTALGLRPRSLHHHAARTRDLEATRAFYEDVLGLPLVGTFIERNEIAAGDGGSGSYVHVFFALADGGLLAFFAFDDADRPGPTQLPSDPFEHHLALRVDSVSDLRSWQQWLADHATPSIEVDHGYCLSLYMSDPNGMIVELAAPVDATDAIFDAARASAHDDLRAWLAGERTPNNHARPPVS